MDFDNTMDYIETQCKKIVEEENIQDPNYAHYKLQALQLIKEVSRLRGAN